MNAYEDPIEIEVQCTEGNVEYMVAGREALDALVLARRMVAEDAPPLQSLRLLLSQVSAGLYDIEVPECGFAGPVDVPAHGECRWTCPVCGTEHVEAEF